MSKQDGLQAIDDLADHKKKTIIKASAAWTSALNELARTGSISPKSFHKVFGIMEQTRDAGKISVFQELTVNHREKIALFLLCLLKPDTSDPNRYVPLLESISIKPNSLSQEVRHLPVSFISEHIESRHLQRDAILLRYDSESFQRLIVTLSLLCQKPPPDPCNDQRSPSIQIPLDSGVLIGSLLDHKDDLPTFDGKAYHRAKKQFFVSGNPYVAMPWKSAVCMKTYVGNGLLRPEQVDLRNQFRNASKNFSDTSELMRILIKTMTAIMPPDKEESAQLLAYQERLESIPFVL